MTAMSDNPKGLGKVRANLIKGLEILLIAAMAVLVLDVLLGVASRYILGQQISWTEELARMLLIWVVLLGGALAFGAGEHLGVDYFMDQLEPDAKRKMAIVADLATLSFTVGVLMIGGYALVSRTFEMEQMMMAIGVPKGAVYLAVPVSGFFFLLFSVESLISNVRGDGAEEREEEAPS